MIGGLRDADGFTPLDAEVFEIGNPGPAIAWARASQHHFASKRSESGPMRRIVTASARHQERERGRLDRLRWLAATAHPVGKFVRKYFRHDISTPPESGGKRMKTAYEPATRGGHRVKNRL